MSDKRKPTVLDDKWITNVDEVPEPRALTTTEQTLIDRAFPLPLEAQKRLLELIYDRKSGIISRQELIDVIFNQKGTPSGTIIRYRA